jgi:type VI secretion system secreted protein VgrG
MALPAQAHRVTAVGTPLGDDVFVLRRMTATERLSRPFAFDVDLLSSNHEAVLKDMLGQPMTIRIGVAEEGTRYFNGIVTQFSYRGWLGGFGRYQARVSPWLWFLTRTSTCRIFQEKTVPQILEAVFSGNGFTAFENRLTGTYRTWDYCVQYRETDFNFVSRLMEQEGICYYFIHENGKHTLILADGYSCFASVAGYDEVPFYPPEATGRRERDHFSEWGVTQEVQSGGYVIRDWDFLQPTLLLESRLSRSGGYALDGLAMFDYPGEFVTTGEGATYVSTRLDELQCEQERVQGSGDAAGLLPGALFTLAKHPRADQNREYLVIASTLDVSAQAYESGGGDGPLYASSILAMDSQTQFRPPRVTPKPVIQGQQTAIVTGKSGEEIWTDEHGRVKVRFHWDRESALDETSSCWLRVGQPWASKGFGAMFIPRVGQEVIVGFLEGDPDRPIVTGTVYNGENKTPSVLPANATQTGIKTNTSKGGGGYNALRFEDKAGEEQILIEAQKDLHTRVKACVFETIGMKRHLVVSEDQMDHVKGSKHEAIDGDHNVKIGGTKTLETTTDYQIKVGGKTAFDSAQEIHLKAGMKVIVEGGTQVSLKVGGNFVDIGPAGVTIQGTMVKINSGGSAGSGSGCTVEAPAAAEEATQWEPGEQPPVGSAEPYEPEPMSPATIEVQAMQAQALQDAAEAGTPFCEQCEAARRAAQS